MAPSAVLSPEGVWLGRERELDQLRAGLERLAQGAGSLLFVTGEPGIGKTRLCDELARLAKERGVPVHWGRAWEAGGAPAYWPFIQVIRGLCRRLGTDRLAAALGGAGVELAQLMPELRELLPERPSPAGSSRRERFELFDAVTALLHAAAARDPFLVVLDDLHAADPSSLELLHFLSRDLRSAPLLLVGTFRDAEARLTPGVGRTLALVARESTTLPLRRLTESEVARYIEQTTGIAPDPTAVAATHRRTEGNPLFLRELLQLQSSTLSQPIGIREVLRARLALLTPASRLVLEAAAVWGREFTLGAVTGLSDWPEAGVISCLALAVDAGIVQPSTEGWRFSHVLLREALHGDLPPGRRRKLHRRAADAIRRHGDEFSRELVHHLMHADVDPTEVADATLRAAERAMDQLAFEDASALLSRVSRLLEDARGQERRRFEVFLALGLARIRSAEVDEGRRACERAIEIARRLNDGELFARAVLASAHEYVPGVHDHGLIARLERALELLPSGDDPLRARCMAQLAAERQPEAKPQQPIELSRAAVAMARRLDDPETLRFTLVAHGLTTLVFELPERRIESNREMLRLALAAGDTLAAVRAHLLLASDLSELGDRAGAEAHVIAYESLVERTRHNRFGWTKVALRANLAVWDGRFDEAAELYRQARELVAADETRGASLAAMPACFCRTAERYDELPEVEARLRDAFGRLHELGACVGEMLIAQLYARVGDHQRVRAQLASVRSHPLFEHIDAVPWLATLAEPCHLLGDVELAERLYPLLLPRAQCFYYLGPYGPCQEPPYSRLLGLIAQTLGWHERAVSHLEEAFDKSRQASLTCHLARLGYDLAGALLAGGLDEDRPRAAALLDDARKVARDLGQTALLAPIEARSIEARSEEPHTKVDDNPRRPSAVTPPPLAEPSSTPLSLRREGDIWAVSFGEQTVRLRDSRGLQVLACLVEHPGLEFHVLQLVTSGRGGNDGGDAGALLDDVAVHDYRRRLLDLREQLDEAESFNDLGRADDARREMDTLSRELARAVGLGGRTRRSGGAAERARTTVQKRVRAAIARISEALPALGQHLDRSVRTGTFCSYLPERRRGGRATTRSR